MAVAVSWACPSEGLRQEHLSEPARLWMAEDQRALEHQANPEVRREARDPVRVRGALLPEEQNRAGPQGMDRMGDRNRAEPPGADRMGDRNRAGPQRADLAELLQEVAPRVQDQVERRPEGRSLEVPRALRP